MFHREKKTAAVTDKNVKNLKRLQTASHFLSEEKRHKLVLQIQELSYLEKERHESLVTVLMQTLVNFCQNLPETDNSYYSQPGGMVDFALNRTEAALSLFKDFLLLDKSEEPSEEQKLWQYALLSAGLLQEIGKVFVSFKVNLFDANGQLLKQWNPLLQSLIHTGSYYNYEFRKESDVELRRRINLILAKTLMPASGFAWIAENEQVLAIWLALLNEDLRSAGTLGALLKRANAIAIQRYINEFMSKANLARTGRYGRAGTFSGGVPESLVDKDLATGVEFIQWLTKSLDEGKIMINKAPLFMVPGGLLMSRELFELFMRGNPDYQNKHWQIVQNGFLSLGLYTAGADGNPVSRFEQSMNQQMHSGVVFSEFAIALPESVQVHQIATGKVETWSALEVINKSQYSSHFTQQQSAIEVAALQKLNAVGKWQAVEENVGLSLSGAKSRG